MTTFGEFEFHLLDTFFGGDFFVAQLSFGVLTVRKLKVNLGLALEVIVWSTTFFWAKVLSALHHVLAWLLARQL